MYHHVSPSSGLVTVSPNIFRSHLHALHAKGWRSAGLSEVERFFAGESLPKKTCVITFDDGYLDNACYAAPLLKEFGFTAVVFVVTGWVGTGLRRTGYPETPDHRECKRRIANGDADSVMMRWSELSYWVGAGVFEVHSHTHYHRRWDKEVADPVLRRSALAEDLATSRSILVEHLGAAGRHLCWPQGYYDSLYTEVATSVGFDYLYTVKPRMNLPNASTLEIGRFVTKEREGNWLVNRASIYGTPWLGRIYSALRST